jgi:hypothetical protein
MLAREWKWARADAESSLRGPLELAAKGHESTTGFAFAALRYIVVAGQLSPPDLSASRSLRSGGDPLPVDIITHGSRPQPSLSCIFKALRRRIPDRRNIRESWRVNEAELARAKNLPLGPFVCA